MHRLFRAAIAEINRCVNDRAVPGFILPGVPFFIHCRTRIRAGIRCLAQYAPCATLSVVHQPKRHRTTGCQFSAWLDRQAFSCDISDGTRGIQPDHAQHCSSAPPTTSPDRGAYRACGARCAGPGPTNRYTQLTDADRVALADRLLAENAGAPFWVFAYGSLIWKPAFEYVDNRNCIAHGWRRSFCLNIQGWRATPEQPGLMLALAKGGACSGIAYRMPDGDPQERMLRLLDREVSYHVDVPWLRWLTVRAKGEAFRALAFYCSPKNDGDLVQLAITEQAARLARAVGPKGSCAEYLLNTVEHLEALGIRDRYLWRLQALVAAEIDSLTFGT